MENSLSLETAKACMYRLIDMGRTGQLTQLGISQSDFDLLTGDEQWSITDRNRVTRTLQSMIYATLDNLSLPRLDVPSEFVAGAICLFVSGVNIMPACRFMGESMDAQTMGRTEQTIKVKNVDSSQLFALCCELFNSGSTSAKAMFTKKTGIALSKAQRESTK